MTHPIISGEMVEKATKAANVAHNKTDAVAIRAALEAVADDIIEACAVELGKVNFDYDSESWSAEAVASDLLDRCAEQVLALRSLKSKR